MTFGQKLRKARETRGFELEAVAAETKIGKRYLQALEADDFATLPGDVFIKGYVRAIGKCIGVDAEPLVAAFIKQRQTAVAPSTEGEPDPVVRELSRVLRTAKRPAAARPGRGPLLPIAFATAGAIGVVTVAWIVADLLRPADLKPLRTQQVLPELAEAADPLPVQGAAPEPVVQDPSTAVPKEPEPEPEPIATAPLPPPPVTQPPATNVQDQWPAVAKAEPAPVKPAPVKPAPPPPTKTTAQAQPPPPTKPAARQPPPPPPSRTTKVAAPPPTEVAAAKPAPPPAPRPAPPRNPLVVADHGTGIDVSASGLVGEAELFHAGTDVYFWTRVQRGKAGDAIRHVWIHEGRQVASISLEIGSGDWPTQSRFPLASNSQGGWTVEARDAGGRVLARSSFVCVSP